MLSKFLFKVRSVLVFCILRRTLKNGERLRVRLGLQKNELDLTYVLFMKKGLRSRDDMISLIKSSVFPVI